MQAKRLQKEIAQLLQSPPDGCVVYPVGDSLSELEAKLHPMASTPYERGVFKLGISIGDTKYPNEPPNVRFVTPVYHPNIDSEGRICLNLLKMPPKGCWAPSYGLASVLAGIQILLAQPNPDDPLMTEITDEYRTDYALFVRKATDWTLKHATGDTFDASNISVVENTDLEKKKEMETQKGKKSPDRKSVASVVVDESVSCVEIRENIPVKRIKL